MLHAHWIWLLYFMAGVLAIALYGLTASGHFPADVRNEKFKGGSGAFVLWATLAATVLAAASVLFKSLLILPWYLSLLGAGGVLLFAPLLLQWLPDCFVDGRSGLLVFSVLAVVLACVMWVQA